MPGASGGKNTPTSPLAVPNNSFKVSNSNNSNSASSAQYHDAFDYEIDTWSNDQYTEHCRNQERLQKLQQQQQQLSGDNFNFS